MTFSENTNLTPNGQSASPSKVKELENKIDDLQQTVTSVADSVADLADEVNTHELNADTANIGNATVDNATVGTETVTTLSATTASADNLNATDASVTNLTADDIEANSIDADNGYFGSANAQSFTGQGVNITGDITASNKVQGKTVQATEKVVTPALESTQTELKGATTVRGDVYFPEDGDKIYGEYLEIEADKVKADIEAETVKVNSLTTETPTGSNQLVGYDNNGNLIPVDAGLDPVSLWQNKSGDITTITPKNNKKVEATEITTPTLNADDIIVSDDITVTGDATLKDTEVDGTLTVNGDIIQNGSAYETHAEKLYTKKDIIITRDGAVSGLSTGEYTGIQAKKYDGTNDGQLVFDKDGEARVGDVGDTEPLLTRDEIANMTNGSLLKWDGTNKKAVCDKSADIIPSDASASNKLATTDAVNTALAGYMPTKMFTSPNGTMQYIKIECNETFGGILLSFNYTAIYFITSEGVLNLNNNEYGLAGVAFSTDKKTIWLKIGGYRRYSITNLSKAPAVTISDATTTEPSGYTFLTTWGTVATKSYIADYTKQKCGAIQDLDLAIPDNSKEVLFWDSSYQPANRPLGGANFLSGMSFKSESGYISQVAFDILSNIYTRVKQSNNIWTSWKTNANLTHLTLGTERTASFTMTAAHSYRLTCGHPIENNKSGLYTIYCASANYSKVENLTSQNNYTITVSGLVVTITATTDYGFITVEDLGNYNA